MVNNNLYKPRPRPQFDVFNRKNRDRIKRYLYATNEEFIKINIYLDKIREEAKNANTAREEISDK